mgnify:CR=1 FL=1
MKERTSLARWTPRRLLSLLMALIMTLSLLPTAALAAVTDYTINVTDAPDQLITGQQSADITATLKNISSTDQTVGLRLTVSILSGDPGDLSTVSVNYKLSTTTPANASGAVAVSSIDLVPKGNVTASNSINDKFNLTFGTPGKYLINVKAVENDPSGGGGDAEHVLYHTTITVKDAIESLTVDPATPEAGQQFTVTAVTNVNNGNIFFKYGAQYESVPVSPALGGTGFARHNFTALSNSAPCDAVLLGVAGVPETMTSITVTPTAAAANHTVTFRANGDNVYTLPAPQTVKSGETATEPTFTPERKGYTFDGWYKEPTCTTKWIFTTPVTGNLELYAKWTAKKITVKFENLSAAEGVKISPDVASTQFSVDSVAHFGVTVPDKYNTSDLFVWIGDTATVQTYLVPVERYEGTDHATGKPLVTLYYQFPVRDDMADPTEVVIGPVTEKTFTVMMPTGHFNAEITGATPAPPAPPVPPATGVGSTVADDKKSASIVYGGGYTFTVKPDTGYDVAVYVNGVKQTAGADGKYTVAPVTGPQSVAVVESAIPNYNVTFTVPQSGELFTQTVMSGGKATKPAVDPIREGYTFEGWYTATEYKKTNGDQFNFTTETITEDTVLYGKLTPKTYIITYDGNGSDGGTVPTPQPKTHGTAIILSTNVPTRTGYTFLGWGMTATATAANYQPGDPYSVDGHITLYAVWKENTYTVTLPTTGQGYSINTEQSTTVTHGHSFKFTVTVDRLYAAAEPTVKANGGNLDADPVGGTSNPDSSITYTYTIPNIQANQVVSVNVTKNSVYTVTFMTGAAVYQTQEVGHGEKATRPVDPKVEGFTFGGWYKTPGCADTDKWDFANDKVTGTTTIYAKLTAIEPVITWPSPTTGYTIAVEGIKAGETSVTTLNSNDKVAYNSTVTFTITISTGYDASKMQVGINGVLLSPKEINGDIYIFEFTAKENTNITVVGVARKTVTIIYNANARDDVSGMPEAQTVKYYLNTATAVNDTIIKQFPVRTGYDFLGWSTNSNAPAADDDYTVAKIEAGTTAKFTENTTLYAVWKAKSTDVTLTITDVAYAPSAARVIQYEGESITLQAALNVGAKGTIEFYKAATSGAAGTMIGSTSINGKSAELSVKVGEYKTTAKDEYYYAIFKSEADEGYADSAKSNEVNVGIFSKAICWVIGDTTASELLVYKGSSATGTPITDPMIARQTYTLKVKTDKITGVETLDSKKPALGKDYKIVWQYYEVDKNDWKTVSESSDNATYLVTGEYSGYQFRAQIVPLGKDHDSLYLKAARYDDTGLLKDRYDVCLYTKPTAATTLQKTTTELAVTGADNEENTVYINGTQPFSATVGSHLAQFEGKKVTLTATVKDASNAAVTKGYVDFYKNGETTPMNKQPIAIGQNGTATYEATTSAFSGDAINAKDTYYAVYLDNDTYSTSNNKTTPETVYIKSTAIQTPIIESTLEGKLNDTSNTVEDNTYYDYNLTGLLAGVQHTFTLRQTGAAATTDNQFSVVAKDGRTVDSSNYDIEWQYKTTGNFAKADNDSTAVTYTTKTTKFGDQYRVVLKAKGDMTVDATSKVAEIGKKQDVTVKVEASADWVYQLNEITLTATVAAKETSSTMKPTGTVTFYYKDGSNWVKLGSAALAEDTNHNMTASIPTTELPVDQTANTKRDVEITAVYEGNETFEESASATVSGTSYSITLTPNCTTNNKTVTVYSSVVYVKDTVENKTDPVTKDHNSGIYIFAEDDKVLANETNVNLKLSEVYTLDHATDAADKAHLAYGTDYTVQWQKLTNAAAYPDKASATWENITSATGTTCQIDVEPGAAYRAVITVKDTPIAKGSYEKIDQGTVGTADKNDGRQVYYSNILVAANAPATLTVNVNTSNTSDGYEGIVEGETVTIHTFTSGATGTTPISQLTVNIYPGKPEEVAAAATAGTPVAPVFTAEKANVNGHVSFDWNKDVTPGYYTLKVKATFTNGYDDKEITRTLIVRDNDYSFNVTGDNAVYNGKVQGLKVAVADMGIENALAQKSVVVYYYTDEARTQQVEPTQAGITYYATIRLQESAYWTEKTVPATFTIKPREVSVVDLVAQAKVYDGTTNANIQEIILNDATVDPATGLPTDGKGIIDGDSVYAVGTGNTSQAAAGTADLGVKNVTLMGDDAANYDLTSYSHTEDFNIQRSQVKGAIVSGRTYKYTGKDIKLAASDIYLIDQAGNQLTNYEVTYYYHNGDGVEKVDAMNKMGKYTVIARPEQTNYKGGATETVYVGTTDNAGTLVTNAVSSLITISNTVELYGATTGVTATATKGTASASYYYDGAWKDTAPTAAGRYLVKVTTSTGDTAYGIYTIVKARPEFTPTTDKSSMEYTSGRYDGTVDAGLMSGSTAETYITYTGGTIQGIAYEAPTEVGKYIATVHVGETANYTAHEKQVAFEITPKALTITADDISRQQYGAYPDLTASFKGLATGGVAKDTSLRDVQIQPELIDKSNYSNDASDQVGNNYKIIAVAALARNYTVSYVDGNMSVTREDPKPYLEIRGMIKNGDNATNLAYYGDVIQLYAYGNQSKTTTGDVHNTSSILAWSVGVGDPATITQDGLLTVKGVGDVTVTLTRGIGAQQISTSLTFKAKKQEVKVVVPAEDKVYDSTTQDYTSTKTLSAVNAMGIKVFSGNDRFVIANKTRSDVGSQIVTGKVSDFIHSFQSETYGGLFTINVKDVTVKPIEATTPYGTAVTGLDYSENTPAGTDKVLTNGMAVSVADAYSNLDVLDGYEILVAGRENENYNVKYVTDQTAPDVEVTAKALIIKTGTLNEQTGMTSGSLNPEGKYPVNGAAINDPVPAMGPSNVRMYGEPNWVMDEALDTLIDGDTLADLAALGGKLVSFNYNIGADANVIYTDKSTKLTVSGSPMPDYKVFTNDSMMAFKNYTETYTLGTQNIYQRPVELKLRDSMTQLNAYKPTIMPGGTVDGTVLRELIINNLIVTQHNNEGGLAELLKHTIKDLDIKISYILSGDTITVDVTIGNQNYYLANGPVTVTVKVDPTKIVAKYGPLGWTSASVTMVGVDESGHETGPVDVSGKVWYEIYKRESGVPEKYSAYKGKTPVLIKEMEKGSSTGVYIVNYPSLPAGEYVMFAIAEGYTIIE